MKFKIVLPKASLLLITALLLTLSVNGCGIFSKKYTKQETVESIISTEGKVKLNLENINGNVRIFRSSDTSDIRIKAHKEIRVKKKYLNTPFDEIVVNIDTAGEIINITTEMKKRKGEFIKFDFGRGPYVDYEIWVPDNFEIAVENVNGKVIADTLTNNINISLVNGDVDLGRSSGKIKCEITNGNFNASVDSTKGIDVNILNGRVTLMLGSYINASFDISTVNGSINEEQIDFYDLTKEKKKLRGKTGSKVENMPEIRIETINGKINLFGKTEI